MTLLLSILSVLSNILSIFVNLFPTLISFFSKNIGYSHGNTTRWPVLVRSLNNPLLFEAFYLLKYFGNFSYFISQANSKFLKNTGCNRGNTTQKACIGVWSTYMLIPLRDGLLLWCQCIPLFLWNIYTPPYAYCTWIYSFPESVYPQLSQNASFQQNRYRRCPQPQLFDTGLSGQILWLKWCSIGEYWSSCCLVMSETLPEVLNWTYFVVWCKFHMRCKWL